MTVVEDAIHATDQREEQKLTCGVERLKENG
jgi:hypothetical protein